MSRDVEIMERADGEHADESELVGDARAKADAIGELGELVRGRLELAADDVPDKRFAAMWREIDKGIDPARHASLDRAAEESGARETKAAGGVWSRVSRFLERFRGHIITGAVTAGAVAALALVLRPGSNTSTTNHDAIDARPVVHRPAEIEDLDTPGGTGTVFNVEDEDGTTTVIWVTPEDTVEGI